MATCGITDEIVYNCNKSISKLTCFPFDLIYYFNSTNFYICIANKLLNIIKFSEITYLSHFEEVIIVEIENVLNKMSWF